MGPDVTSKGGDSCARVDLYADIALASREELETARAELHHFARELELLFSRKHVRVLSAVNAAARARPISPQREIRSTGVLDASDAATGSWSSSPQFGQDCADERLGSVINLESDCRSIDEQRSTESAVRDEPADVRSICASTGPEKGTARSTTAGPLQRLATSTVGIGQSITRTLTPEYRWSFLRNRETRRRFVRERYQEVVQRHQEIWAPFSETQIVREVTTKMKLDKARNSPCGEPGSKPIAAFVRSGGFQVAIAMAVLLNVVFLAWHVHDEMQAALRVYNGHDAKNEMWADPFLVEVCFNAFFATEILLRVCALRRHFFIGEGWRWSIFDALLVLISCVDMFIRSFTSVQYLRVLRLLRTFRSFRMLRLLRFMRLFSQLRLISAALLKSFGNFIWAVVAILAMTFMFSVVFVSATAEYIRHAATGDDNANLVERYFHSVPMAVVTLFMSVMGGLNWEDLLRMFLDISSLHACFFIFYVLFAMLVVLNIITGIFVNDAKDIASLDREVLIQCELERDRKILRDLRSLFQELDTQRVGIITRAQFNSQVVKEPARSRLAMIGLSVEDADAFFRLLDVGNCSELQLEEFIIGCLRLRGKTADARTELMLQEAHLQRTKLISRVEGLAEAVLSISTLIDFTERVPTDVPEPHAHFEVPEPPEVPSDRSVSCAGLSDDVQGV